MDERHAGAETVVQCLSCMGHAKILVTDGRIEMVMCEACAVVVSGATAQTMIADLVRRETKRFGADPDSIKMRGVESGAPFDIMGIATHDLDAFPERWPFVVTFTGPSGD